MKKIEQNIKQMTDVAELNRIGQKYANSGNYIIAMKAWLRAAKLGDRQCRSSIVSIFLSKYWYVSNEEHKQVAKMIKQWCKEGDEQVKKTIDFQKELRAVMIQ